MQTADQLALELCRALAAGYRVRARRRGLDAEVSGRVTGYRPTRSSAEARIGGEWYVLGGLEAVERLQPRRRA